MSRKKFTDGTKKRLQVMCTPEQETIIDTAAEAAGLKGDRSAWILAHALAAATKGSSAQGAPILITGDLADRVRKAAEQQGVTPAQIVEQWAIVGASTA